MQSNVFYLLAPESGEQLATLESPNGDHITSLVFSPNGTRLAMQGRLSRELFVRDLPAVRGQLAAMHLDWARPPVQRKAQPRRENRIASCQGAHTDIALSETRHAREADGVF